MTGLHGTPDMADSGVELCTCCRELFGGDGEKEETTVCFDYGTRRKTINDIQRSQPSAYLESPFYFIFFLNPSVDFAPVHVIYTSSSW
jgi:hypothetical protein